MMTEGDWFAGHRGARLKWGFPILLVLMSLALVTAALFANVNRSTDWSKYRQLVPGATPGPSITVALPNLIKPLSPEEAIRENLARPFDAPPDTPAQKFELRADEDSRDRAIECLTQAVYYEAASEGADGERAVAQVVLNRMHHPGFPSTVCGVVYQGSELPTGCQFTFTCDGSLARTPIPSVWNAARKIAMEALGGKVFAAVGHATHYHADYVLPYWADSLLKQVQIGHHIFYRLEGNLGSSAAFSQRYGGKEPNPLAPPSTVTVASQAADEAEKLLDSGLAAPKPEIPVAADAAGIAAAQEPKQVLLADASKGELLIDHGAPAAPPPAHKKHSEGQCPAEGGKEITAATPSDFRAGKSSPGC